MSFSTTSDAWRFRVADLVVSQARGCPLGEGCDATGQFLDLKSDRAASDLHQCVAEEPAVFVFHRASQVTSGAGHRQICDAFQFCVDHLMDVAGHDVLDSVFFRQLMHRVLRVL